MGSTRYIISTNGVDSGTTYASKARTIETAESIVRMAETMERDDVKRVYVIEVRTVATGKIVFSQTVEVPALPVPAVTEAPESLPELSEGDRVRVVGVPSLPNATGTFSHTGRHAYGITLDNGNSILVKFGHLELIPTPVSDPFGFEATNQADELTTLRAMGARPVTLAPVNTPCQWTRATGASDVTLHCVDGVAIHVLRNSVPGIPAGTAVCAFHSPYDVTEDERDQFMLALNVLDNAGVFAEIDEATGYDIDLTDVNALPEPVDLTDVNALPDSPIGMWPTYTTPLDTPQHYDAGL